MKDYARTAQGLLDEMRSHAGVWDWLRCRIMPRAQANSDMVERPEGERNRKLSTVANESLKVLASAHLTYITPMGQRWFAIKSAQSGKKVTARDSNWFAEATETTYLELARSNFYTAMHECYLDRCLTGTGCVFADQLQDGTLNFRHVPTGTFAIAEGANGQVDSLVRIFKLTAHQAATQFGEDVLTEKVREACADPKKRYTEKYEFAHLVLPRPMHKHGHEFVPAEDQKWASIYLSWDSEKKVLQESGYYEFPFLVTRFLKYGESPYGHAPGMDVREEVEGTLKLERVMDVLGEVAAFPRLLQLAEQAGEVDLRAGGITTISPQAAKLNLPREWGTSGRYDVGVDRIDRKEEKIKQAFFVPMLQVISSVDRQMTATEVNAREAEKVLAFSPSFTLFISDFSVLMHRIFSMLLRAGKYPEQNMPQELIVPDQGGGENWEIAVPTVAYLGKISQAIERVQRYGIESLMQTVFALSQASGDTSMLDAFNLPKIVRWLYESSGAPMDGLRSEEEVDAISRQRQQVIAAQQQMEVMQGGAKAARDMATAQTTQVA